MTTPSEQPAAMTLEQAIEHMALDDAIAVMEAIMLRYAKVGATAAPAALATVLRAAKAVQAMANVPDRTIQIIGWSGGKNIAIMRPDGQAGYRVAGGKAWGGGRTEWSAPITWGDVCEAFGVRIVREGDL